MQQKATAEFDLQAKTLTITGELQPETPLLHDALMELLHGTDQLPEVETSLLNNNNVLSYSVRFKESQGPSAADLDISVLQKEIAERDVRYKEEASGHVETRKKLDEANSTITLLEDRLATAGKVAQMATDELVAIRNTAVPDHDALSGPQLVGKIEPAPSND